MSRQTRICGFQLGSVGVLAVLLYFIDRSIAALDGYVPGEDYPVYTEVPDGLSFTCDDKIPGYYADPETQCQVWHWCVPGLGGNTKYSFLCGPGTVFNQRTRVCDWFFKIWHWSRLGGNTKYSFLCGPGTVFNRTRVCDWFFKTDCPNSAAYYGINEDLYKDEQGNFITGKKDYSYDNSYDERRLTARRKRQEMAKTQNNTENTNTNKHTKRQTAREMRQANRQKKYHEINRKAKSNDANSTTIKSVEW